VDGALEVGQTKKLNAVSAAFEIHVIRECAREKVEQSNLAE
jgi:hypothetical protein